MIPVPNTFKTRVHARDQQVGLFATLNSPALLEVLAGWDFDWILIDTEHSPTEMADVIAQLRVLDLHGVSAVVRPAWSDMTLIKRLLDAGARNLLIPCVESAEEARAAVSYTRYPPHGVRGVSGSSRAASYGQNRDYLRNAEKEVCVFVQIESAKGLANLEEFALVQGVDGVFVGPADLAASLEHLGEPQHPDVLSAVDDAFARLDAAGVATGYLSTDPAESGRRLAAGVHVVGIATDTSIVNRGAALTLESVRAGRETRRAG